LTGTGTVHTSGLQLPVPGVRGGLFFRRLCHSPSVLASLFFSFSLSFFSAPRRGAAVERTLSIPGTLYIPSSLSLYSAGTRPRGRRDLQARSCPAYQRQLDLPSGGWRGPGRAKSTISSSLYRASGGCRSGGTRYGVGTDLVSGPVSLGGEVARTWYRALYSSAGSAGAVDLIGGGQRTSADSRAMPAGSSSATVARTPPLSRSTPLLCVVSSGHTSAVAVHATTTVACQLSLRASNRCSLPCTSSRWPGTGRIAYVL
jgi:hypothetical protein